MGVFGFPLIFRLFDHNIEVFVLGSILPSVSDYFVLCSCRFKKRYDFLYENELPAERKVCLLLESVCRTSKLCAWHFCNLFGALIGVEEIDEEI